MICLPYNRQDLNTIMLELYSLCANYISWYFVYNPPPPVYQISFARSKCVVRYGMRNWYQIEDVPVLSTWRNARQIGSSPSDKPAGKWGPVSQHDKDPSMFQVFKCGILNPNTDSWWHFYMSEWEWRPNTVNWFEMTHWCRLWRVSKRLFDWLIDCLFFKSCARTFVAYGDVTIDD